MLYILLNRKSDIGALYANWKQRKNHKVVDHITLKKISAYHMTSSLALSPGLFFSLNVMKGTKETNGWTDKHARKTGLVSIAGIVVCVR